MAVIVWAEQSRIETNVPLVSESATNSQGEEMTYLGRYLDRFERRGAEWRIGARVIVMSWTRLAPASHDPQGRAVAGLRSAGRKPDDPLYE